MIELTFKKTQKHFVTWSPNAPRQRLFWRIEIRASISCTWIHISSLGLLCFITFNRNRSWKKHHPQLFLESEKKCSHFLCLLTVYCVLNTPFLAQKVPPTKYFCSAVLPFASLLTKTQPLSSISRHLPLSTINKGVGLQSNFWARLVIHRQREQILRVSHCHFLFHLPTNFPPPPEKRWVTWFKGNDTYLNRKANFSKLQFSFNRLH